MRPGTTINHEPPEAHVMSSESHVVIHRRSYQQPTILIQSVRTFNLHSLLISACFLVVIVSCLSHPNLVKKKYRCTLVVYRLLFLSPSLLPTKSICSLFVDYVFIATIYRLYA
ncbi:BnaCnng72840D [Brassica napus]|uniref:(rape) hypothetical protein n=1 Tax=Brassica napus TaxID=3708 RepID=A0A078JXI0_BRANA|nr:unnamed protein product [Brassica napus]CDY71424.1 BnaCnng72840D [Brassica napus]